MLAALLVAFLSGQTADVATSLALPSPRFYESNVLVPSRPVPFVAVKASLTTTVAMTGWKIRKQHPKIAAVLFLAGAASGTFAALHNARLLAQNRR